MLNIKSVLHFKVECSGKRTAFFLNRQNRNHKTMIEATSRSPLSPLMIIHHRVLKSIEITNEPTCISINIITFK